MQDGNSPGHRDRRAIAKAQIEILQLVAGGQFEGLCCPGCSIHAMSAWFMKVDQDYFTLCVCAECSFEFEAIGERPANFTEARVLVEREEVREQLRQRYPKRFPKPPPRR